MLLVMWTVAPNGWCRGDSRAPRNCRRAQHEHPVITTTEVRSGEQDHAGTDDLRNLLPAEAHQSQSFSRSYGSVLPTSLAYIVPLARGQDERQPIG